MYGEDVTDSDESRIMESSTRHRNAQFNCGDASNARANNHPADTLMENLVGELLDAIQYVNIS